MTFQDPRELVRCINAIRPFVDMKSHSRTDNSALTKRKVEESQTANKSARADQSHQVTTGYQTEEAHLPQTQVDNQASSSGAPRKKASRFSTSPPPVSPSPRTHTISRYSVTPPTDPRSDRTLRPTGNTVEITRQPWQPDPLGITNALGVYGANETPDTQAFQNRVEQSPRLRSIDPIDEAVTVSIAPLEPTPSQRRQPEVPLIRFDSPPPLVASQHRPPSSPVSPQPRQPSASDLIRFRASGSDEADAEAAELDLGGLFPPLRPPNSPQARNLAPSGMTQSLEEVCFVSRLALIHSMSGPTTISTCQGPLTFHFQHFLPFFRHQRLCFRSCQLVKVSTTSIPSSWRLKWTEYFGREGS